MVMKLKKRRKSKGQRGTTRYHGARKKWNPPDIQAEKEWLEQEKEQTIKNLSS